MTTLYGHDVEIERFKSAALGDRMHHAWLIHGPKGIGKGLFVRQAATWLLAMAAGPEFDADGFSVPLNHPISHLVKEKSHPDYRILTRLMKDKTDALARDISTEQIRAMQRVLENKPALSDRRVIIIDSLDELNASGANALLKALEEPPPGAIFLLVSHSPGRVLPTIRSRCFQMKLSPLSQAEMVKALIYAEPPIDAAEMDDLIALANGVPGLAISYADKDMLGLDRGLQRILASGDPQLTERIALAKSLSPKTASDRLDLFLDHVPAFIAKHARSANQAAAISAWEKARELAPAVRRLTLDPYMAIFELGSLVAGLAPQRS